MISNQQIENFFNDENSLRKTENACCEVIVSLEETYQTTIRKLHDARNGIEKSSFQLLCDLLDDAIKNKQEITVATYTVANHPLEVNKFIPMKYGKYFGKVKVIDLNGTIISKGIAYFTFPAEHGTITMSFCGDESIWRASYTSAV